jgi:hypothetical protein
MGMKHRKIAFMLLLAAGLVMSLVLGAQAAQGWYLNYSVASVGPMVVAGGATVNRIGVTLTKIGGAPATINAWFTAGREKEMQATALSAIVYGKRVDALVDTTVVNNRYTIIDLLVK